MAGHFSKVARVTGSFLAAEYVVLLLFHWYEGSSSSVLTVHVLAIVFVSCAAGLQDRGMACGPERPSLLMSARKAARHRRREAPRLSSWPCSDFLRML